jgi:hypothetical protein
MDEALVLLIGVGGTPLAPFGTNPAKSATEQSTKAKTVNDVFTLPPPFKADCDMEGKVT